MSVKKILSLTSGKQLIDLNGDHTNFDLTFTATSLDNSDFHALVIDQTTLDKVPHDKLEFKKATGSISGNIVSDNNIYQNFFLCLKSDKPCEVEVVINKKEIQPKPRKEVNPLVQQQSVKQSLKQDPIKPFSTNWKLICIGIVLVIGGGLCYYMYVNKNKKQKNQSIENTMTPSISNLITSPSLVSAFNTKPSLSDRLDKLLK